MAQMYKYSASSSTSIAALNKTAPAQADLMGAQDPSGLLKPIQVDASGLIKVTLSGTTSDVNAYQAGTWNLNNISGTISLPTGAATEATLSSLDTKVTTSVNGILVDGSGVTQPISAASLPLPSGASTSAAQTDGSQKTQIVDSLGNVVSTTGNALDVNIASGSIVATNPSVSNTAALVPVQATYVGANQSGNLVGLTLDSASNLNSNVQKITGIIDANNTSSTPLGANATFTGGWTEIRDYNSINLGVFSDVASATDGLKIQYSADGVSVHHTHLWTFPGGANGIGYQLAAEFRYFRIQYVNGPVAQTSFQLISNLKPTALAPSSYRVSQTFTSQSQVLLTKGVIVGESTTGGGTYVNVKVAPSGALTTESTLAGLDAAVLGQDTMANSLPVVIASNQSAVPVSGTVTANAGTGNFTVVQPTAANLNATVVGSVTANAGTGDFTVVQPTASNLNATVVNSGTFAVQAAQSGTWNINNVSGTISLPTNAATESTLSSLNTKIPSQGQALMAASVPVVIASNQSNVPANITQVGGASLALGQTTMANSIPVVFASNQSSISTSASGTAKSNAPVYNSYSSVNITTSAYVQLIASTTSATNNIHIFDSSGQAMILAIGGAGAEVDTLYVPPGGDTYNLNIPAGSRVSYKALTANATSGYLLISLLQ